VKSFVLLCAACSLAVMLNCGEVTAQDGLTFGVSVSRSIITGTPEREPPQTGEHLTGAGNENGWRVALLTSHSTRVEWMDIGIEIFANRLGTEGLYFNCVHDENFIPPDPTRENKVCFLAADEDRAIGVMIGPTLYKPRQGIRPFLSLKAGAAQYRLYRDPATTSGGQDYTTEHTRPVYKVAGGAATRWKGHALAFDIGLEQGLGRGAGTSHIPIGFTFTY
jgi:hypothetical protein